MSRRSTAPANRQPRTPPAPRSRPIRFRIVRRQSLGRRGGRDHVRLHRYLERRDVVVVELRRRRNIDACRIQRTSMQRAGHVHDPADRERPIVRVARGFGQLRHRRRTSLLAVESDDADRTSPSPTAPREHRRRGSGISATARHRPAELRPSATRSAATTPVTLTVLTSAGLDIDHLAHRCRHDRHARGAAGFRRPSRFRRRRRPSAQRRVHRSFHRLANVVAVELRRRLNIERAEPDARLRHARFVRRVADRCERIVVLDRPRTSITILRA